MTGVLLIVLFLGLVALSLWAVVDCALQPAQAFAEVGLSRTAVSGLLILTCALGAVVYALAVRPRLLRAVGRRR